jgi:TctA family transporter
MDYDILFLIPVTWAAPVFYPVLVSVTLLVFAMIMLHRSSRTIAIRATWLDWLAFSASGIIVVVSFCIAGLHITEQDAASHFYRPLFIAGYLLGVVTFVKCLLKSR